MEYASDNCVESYLRDIELAVREAIGRPAVVPETRVQNPEGLPSKFSKKISEIVPVLGAERLVSYTPFLDEG